MQTIPAFEMRDDFDTQAMHEITIALEHRANWLEDYADEASGVYAKLGFHHDARRFKAAAAALRDIFGEPV